jgi:hypothetical protein
MEKVSVNRGVLIGIIAVAAASLLGLAFLLGRLSGSGNLDGRSAAQTRPSDVESPLDSALRAWNPTVPIPNPASPSNSTTGGADLAPAPGAGAAPQADPWRAPTQVAGSRAGEGGDREKAAVAAYLDAVDRIQPQKMGGSAESVAAEMATALANGDTSGLDRFIRETEAARSSLAALMPPEVAATYHRESLASLDDALEMLRSLKTAMASPDPTAQLGVVATRASALRSRSEVLQKEEGALRERYGLRR